MKWILRVSSSIYPSSGRIVYSLCFQLGKSVFTFNKCDFFRFRFHSPLWCSTFVSGTVEGESGASFAVFLLAHCKLFHFHPVTFYSVIIALFASSDSNHVRSRHECAQEDDRWRRRGRKEAKNHPHTTIEIVEMEKHCGKFRARTGNCTHAKKKTLEHTDTIKVLQLCKCSHLLAPCGNCAKQLSAKNAVYMQDIFLTAPMRCPRRDGANVL